jgi:hypothetical protein
MATLKECIWLVFAVLKMLAWTVVLAVLALLVKLGVVEET